MMWFIMIVLVVVIVLIVAAVPVVPVLIVPVPTPVSVLLSPAYLLPGRGGPPAQVELAEPLPLGDLPADKDPVKMTDLPDLWVHILARLVIEFELLEQVLVLFPVFHVELEEVHGRLDHNSVQLQKFLKLVHRDQPLLNVLDLPSLRVLLAHCLLQVKLVRVSEGLAEFGILEPNREVLVAVNHRPICLPDTFLMDLLENSVPIRNGSYEHPIDEKVREDGVKSVLQTLLTPKHIMKTQLSRHDIVITVVCHEIEFSLRKVLGYGVQSVRLVLFIPSPLVLLYALFAEVVCHHVIHPAESPF